MYQYNMKTLDDLLRYAKDVDKFMEMEEFFNKRTERHINLVRKYCDKIHNYYPDQFEGIIERGEEHDQSKYADPEVIPYIYITWDYRCKDLGIDPGISDEIHDEMNAASEHHVHNNRHHPEFFCNEKSTINREDRDAVPDKIIDATEMDDLDIAEMVADWWAMSEEKGDKSPKAWADKNVNKRWKFTKEQKNLIYELIDALS